MLWFFFSLLPSSALSHLVFSGWAWLSPFCWSLYTCSGPTISSPGPHHLRLPRSQLLCLFHHPAINTIFPGQHSVPLLFSKWEREREREMKKTRQGGKNVWQRKGKEKKGFDEVDAEVLECGRYSCLILFVHLHIYLLPPPTFTDSSILPASVLKQYQNPAICIIIFLNCSFFNYQLDSKKKRQF